MSSVVLCLPSLLCLTGPAVKNNLQRYPDNHYWEMGENMYTHNETYKCTQANEQMDTGTHTQTQQLIHHLTAAHKITQAPLANLPDGTFQFDTKGSYACILTHIDTQHTPREIHTV